MWFVRIILASQDKCLSNKNQRCTCTAWLNTQSNCHKEFETLLRLRQKETALCGCFHFLNCFYIGLCMKTDDPLSMKGCVRCAGKVTKHRDWSHGLNGIGTEEDWKAENGYWCHCGFGCISCSVDEIQLKFIAKSFWLTCMYWQWKIFLFTLLHISIQLFYLK